MTVASSSVQRTLMASMSPGSGGCPRWSGRRTDPHGACPEPSARTALARADPRGQEVVARLIGGAPHFCCSRSRIPGKRDGSIIDCGVAGGSTETCQAFMGASWVLVSDQQEPCSRVQLRVRPHTTRTSPKASLHNGAAAVAGHPPTLIRRVSGPNVSFGNILDTEPFHCFAHVNPRERSHHARGKRFHMSTAPHRTMARLPVRLLQALLAAVLAAALLSWAGHSQVHAAPGDGSVSDPNISYVGRWDTSSGTAAVPHWTGGYLQTAFTGTTVKVKARDAVNFYASIDGGADVFYAGVKGTVNLTPQPAARGQPHPPGLLPLRRHRLPGPRAGRRRAYDQPARAVRAHRVRRRLHHRRRPHRPARARLVRLEDRRAAAACGTPRSPARATASSPSPAARA